MKFKIRGMTAIGLAILGIAFCAHAKGPQAELLPISDVSNVPLSTGVATMDAGANMELFRLNNGKEHNHMTYVNMPSNWEDLGWRLEGSLGFVYSTYFEGARPLYNCYLTTAEVKWLYKYFTSADPNCEGWYHSTSSTFGWFLGYAASTQLPGTVPLYRCYINLHKEHFDTLTSNCEGLSIATNDGIIAYVWL